MQPHTLNSRPSGRYSGNVAEAIQALNMDGYAAIETADGLLTFDYQSDIEGGEYIYIECPHVFPIVAGRVDMGAVAAFIGH